MRVVKLLGFFKTDLDGITDADALIILWLTQRAGGFLGLSTNNRFKEFHGQEFTTVGVCARQCFYRGDLCGRSVGG
jgi:hypothetical protein